MENDKMYYVPKSGKYDPLEYSKFYYHNSRKTPIGLLRIIYSTQVAKSRKRNHPSPEYSRQEFVNRFINDSIYLSLFKNWKDNKYDKWLKPSCDRLDNKIHYKFDNIQFITWRENDQKQKKSDEQIQLAVNAAQSRFKTILQYDLEGNLIREWDMKTREIETTEFFKNISNIRSACLGRIKISCGFKWKYKDGR